MKIKKSNPAVYSKLASFLFSLGIYKLDIQIY